MEIFYIRKIKLVICNKRLYNSIASKNKVEEVHEKNIIFYKHIILIIHTYCM